MATWYRVDIRSWQVALEEMVREHRVVRVTPRTVVYECRGGEHREAKAGSRHRWYDSKEAALLFAEAYARRQLERAQADARRWGRIYDQITDEMGITKS